MADLHEIGNSGVDLFFVLSGYLIYGTLMRRPQSFGAFMIRRVRRIYPAFLVVFVTYMALAFAIPSLGAKLPATGLPSYFLANLLLLPGLFPIEPLITVAWSLSYEMFFYLLLPVVIALARLRQWAPVHRIAALVMIAGVLFAYCAAVGGLAPCNSCTNMPATNIASRTCPVGAVGGVLLLPVMFALTLVPSLLLYLAVERPLSLGHGARVVEAGQILPKPGSC
ncbi:acyltransferase [Piscinibacter sp. XHJ-5]|uniref:acyltransferase family protein n=1 Tax=Piscinibacter sp. XHJ-5 TaxID=3037797 RepID=UPI0024532876|nr:acyltransferase [Piscinibacter sp. XHJ-5]